MSRYSIKNVSSIANGRRELVEDRIPHNFLDDPVRLVSSITSAIVSEYGIQLPAANLKAEFDY